MVNTANATNLSSPVRRLIALNGSGGAFIVISASIFAGYVEIVEVPAEPYSGGAFTGEGTNYQRADENYANTYPLVPGGILQIGDAILKNRSVGVPGFTQSDGTARPATPYFKMKSASANATNVQITEWLQQ